MIPMWKETLVVMVALIIVEVVYRIVDSIWFKSHNLAGEMESEEE